MKHWYWCRVLRNDEIDTNGERVEAILTAHGLEVDMKSSDPPAGAYMVLLPEQPENLDLLAVRYGAGELVIEMES